MRLNRQVRADFTREHGTASVATLAKGPSSPIPTTGASPPRRRAHLGVSFGAACGASRERRGARWHGGFGEPDKTAFGLLEPDWTARVRRVVLQVFRPQARVLRDPRQHSRPDLIAVVEGKDEVGPAGTSEYWCEPARA